MSWSLAPHPSTLPKHVQSIDVSIQSDGCQALIHYLLMGSVPLIPRAVTPTRSDDLWRTTCFEVFIRRDTDAYVEFNFSPSGQWAAYNFDRYRAGRSDLPMHIAPRIEPVESGVRVLVDLRTTAAPDRTPIALSAVIEETDGTRTYWALAHAPGPPDFHNPACFTATLPPPAKP